MQPIRLLLTSQHIMLLQGMAALLDQQSDLKVIGEAADGATALHMIAMLAPDVTVLAAQLPDMSGLDVVHQLPPNATRVLILNAAPDDPDVEALVAAGVWGYLRTTESASHLLRAIRGVAQGQGGWYSPSIAERLTQTITSPNNHDDLTSRELEVMRLVDRGYSNTEIAEQLHISIGTVKNHVTRSYKKLGVHSRAEAVAVMWGKKLVEDG